MNQLQPGEHDVILNGVRIHYTVRGSGPPLIAHSGGPGADARTWNDLAGIDEFVTLIIIHPRGSGLSGEPTDGAYRLPNFADDLEALRRQLDLIRPAIMGWSHGGLVAQQFAFSYPESLSKLILFDTTAYFGEFLGDLQSAVEAFRDQPWYEASYTALEKEWAGEYETDEDMSRLWAEEMKFYFKSFDARAMAYHERTRGYPMRIDSLKVFNAEEAETLDLRSRLAGISVPTLIIVGRHDFITTCKMAEEMAKHIPDAQLEVFEDSGHFAFVEEPEKFYRVLRAFILGD